MSRGNQYQEDIETLELLNSQKSILLFNDDVNTFEHVIKTLIDVCDHTPQQAEKCSLIVHYKGKCSVKSGSLSDLKPRCEKLLSAGFELNFFSWSDKSNFDK